MFNLKRRKGQSAIEYLMTYGWMLLVVAVVGGAVFSMVGEQSIESVQGFDSSSVNVQDFGVSVENGLTFLMSDPVGQTKIDEITVSNSDTGNITYAVNQEVSEQNNINLPGIRPSGDNNELEIKISYDSANLENLTTSGVVTGTLEVDENFHNHTMMLDGLVGYWPLDEAYKSGGEVFDFSGNQNHGKKEENPEWGEGVHGSALEFDGTNYVGIDANTGDNLDITDDLTLTAWVTVEDTTRQYVINRNEDAGFSNTQYHIGTNSGEIEVTIGGDDYSVDFPDSWESTFTDYRLIAMTWDGSDIRVYGNGEHLDTFRESSMFSRPNLRISGRTGSNDFYWNGKIDEVRVYDRALSENEINSIYEQGDQ